MEAEPPATRLERLLRLWVAGQKAYFQRAAARDQRRLERLRRLSHAFLLVHGLLLVLILAAAPEAQPGETLLQRAGSAHELLILSAGLAAVLAAFVHGYGEKRALSEHVKQYQIMQLVFATAEERLRAALAAGDPAAAVEVVRALGREALAENGDWVLLHRERPLEVPQPG